MTGDDLLAEAIADLYSADPEEFMHRRQELAGRARSAGQAVVAKQITALRKPTRSAWMINQLARSDPDATARLTELGDELRAVERSGDGRRLRELSQTRRQLVATLVRRVLEVSGQDSMPAAVREEITATFAAALADTEVAEQIRHGALVRAERWSGFGTAHAPTLTVVPPLPDSHRAAKIKPKTKPKPKTDAPMAVTPTPSAATTRDRIHTPTDQSATTGDEPATSGDRSATTGDRSATSGDRAATAGDQTRTAGDLAPATRAETAAARAERAAERAEQAAAEAKAAQERRKAKVRAKAEEALAKADQAVTDAAQEQQEQEKSIRRLERELAKARSGLRAAVADARRAEAAQRKAHQVLARLPD